MMIGVIADDLTGAAEIGAVGWRHGLRAEVVIRGNPGDDADLVCVDTDSRLCTPEKAAQRTRKAALMLQNRGIEWIYKKTDSLLRGNVTSEIEATVKELGFRGALLVPANPSHHRTIVGGEFFVEGKPVHQTEFARDPVHPRLHSGVLDLITPPSTLPVFTQNYDQPLPKRGIVLGDAAVPEDLFSWANRRSKSWLMAGGAEFFDALLKPGLGCQWNGIPIENELFVCGSTSRATQRFVKNQASIGVPQFQLPAQVLMTDGSREAALKDLADEVIAAFESSSRVILQIGLPPISDPAVAKLLVSHLARVVQLVISRVPAPHIFAEGGATAAALARRMRWNRFEVKGELSAGVVCMALKVKPFHLFTIKPGSYEWPESLVRPKRWASS